jgi:hypothetical protein
MLNAHVCLLIAIIIAALFQLFIIVSVGERLSEGSFHNGHSQHDGCPMATVNVTVVKGYLSVWLLSELLLSELGSATKSLHAFV